METNMSKVDEAFDLISAMTILEARDLVKRIEEEFGVTAAAPVAVAAAGSNGGAAAAAESVEEQTEFDVVLAEFGDKKINVIKAVRAVTELGLREAKEFVESVPQTLKEAVTQEEADSIKAALEEAGATVEIK